MEKLQQQPNYSKMEIEIRNKIKRAQGNAKIAAFMGAEVDHVKILKWPDDYKPMDDNISAIVLQYHCSFDWMAPVIEKIESLFRIVKTYTWSQTTTVESKFVDFSIEIVHTQDLPQGYKFTSSGDTKIESMFLCVLNFIDWFYETKQK